MIEDKLYDLSAKYLSGNMSSEEAAAFLKEIQKDEKQLKEFQQLESLWGASVQPVTPSIQQNAWEKLQVKLEGEKDSIAIQKPMWKKWIAVAASIFLLASIAIWMNQSTSTNAIIAQPQFEEYQSDGLSQKEITLADNSIVWLNKNSKIKFSSNPKERIIHLEGEAFFEVAKDPQKPFSVNARGTTTTVLGTAFNLRAYPEENNVELNVEHGKVNFKGPQNELVLTQAQSASFDKNALKIVPNKTYSSNNLSWKTNVINFDDHRMEYVIQTLERHYSTKIKTQNENLLNCHFSGKFKDVKLSTIIEAIAFAMDLKIEETPQMFSLKGEGCELQ